MPNRRLYRLIQEKCKYTNLIVSRVFKDINGECIYFGIGTSSEIVQEIRDYLPMFGYSNEEVSEMDDTEVLNIFVKNN